MFISILRKFRSNIFNIQFIQFMTINCKGNLIDLSIPKVMGILNSTPDSFYEKSRVTNDKELLKKVELMIEEGATFIDLGGYSTRPGAKQISVDEELKRTVVATELILKRFPNTLLSIDTFRAKVAKENIAVGACIVNDITAGTIDAEMLSVIGQLKVAYIMMHLKGSPHTMQTHTKYNKEIAIEVCDYFSERIQQAVSNKINDIIIDVGFGFSKDITQNYQLMGGLEKLKILNRPILTGISRKSMIHKVLDIEASESLIGTSVLHLYALQQGSTILRVHDVKAAVECIKIYEMIEKNRD